jgi:hypothetical protein
MLAPAARFFGIIGKTRKFSPDSHDNKVLASARSSQAGTLRKLSGRSTIRKLLSARRFSTMQNARSHHKG